MNTEHRRLEIGSRVVAWGDPAVWILLPFRKYLDPQNLDTFIL